MKIYLASFSEPENFGPGRIIGIVDGGPKPHSVNVEWIFKPFTPPKELIIKYNDLRLHQPIESSNFFVSSYTEQLDSFFLEVKFEAKQRKKKISDLLPFNEGDTLASWERAAYTNYRKILAPFLEKMGFEVVLN